jgi:thiol-disulfide isomerase/thioredoxin
MRIRYFALIATVAVLSLGAVTGCNSSTTSSSLGTTTAEKVNPCASKANPCAAKTTNSVAATTQPVGGLATELQGKPVVVDIYASWCPACKNVAPALATLKKEYDGKVNFVVLDVSDKASTTKSIARAKELGLDKFLAKNQSQTGLIAVIDSATGKTLIEEQNNADVASYKKPLDTLIAKAK